MSASQSPSKPDFVQRIKNDARVLMQAHMRGARSVCTRIRKFSSRFSDASDEVILAVSAIDAHGIVSREYGFESWPAVHEASIGHKFLLDIAMPLVFALLGKEADDERWLTEEEKGRMEPVFHDILAELQRAWELVVPTIFRNVQIETDPKLVKVTEPDALVVLVGLEITSVEHSGLIPVAYPLPGGIYELRQHFDRKN